jgi:Flp pilus assembly protein TadG
MNSVQDLARDTRGSAAAELMLVMPILLIIMMGAFELGNYFRSEHILVQGLRDGARYAARQSFSNYRDNCSAALPNTNQIWIDTLNVVRTGQVAGGSDRLPNWTDASTDFQVAVTCSSTAGAQTMLGIYRDNKSSTGTAIGAPIVTVSAHVPYRSILGKYGFTGIGMSLNGTQQAAVMGI